MSVYKGITLDNEIAKRIQAWAESPAERRTFSNAVEALCMKALDAMKAEPKPESKPEN